MKAAFAHVSNIKAFPSQGTARIELEIPIESYKAVVDEFFGGDVLLTLAPLALKGEPYGMVEAANDEAPPRRAPAGDGNGGGANRPGPLCMLAVQWCREPTFWKWLGLKFSFTPDDEEQAAMFLRDYLEIESRKELDTDERAGLRFKAHIRLPYMEYRKEQGLDA